MVLLDIHFLGRRATGCGGDYASKTGIDVWHSDMPFWLKWKLLVGK